MKYSGIRLYSGTGLSIDEIKPIVEKIVSKEAAPVIICRNCGFGTWLFEFSLKSFYEKYSTACEKCSDDSSHIILADFESEL